MHLFSSFPWAREYGAFVWDFGALWDRFPDEDNIEILKPLEANFFAAAAPIPVPAAVNTATL